MQCLTLVRLTVPDRHHVGVADRVVHRNLQHAELDQIKRIDPSRPPARARIHPRKLTLLLQQRFLRLWNKDEAIQQSFDRRKLVIITDLFEKAVSVKLRISGARIKEAQVGLDVEFV